MKNQRLSTKYEKQVERKVNALVVKAEKEMSVDLNGFRATFTNRGKSQVVSYKREAGRVVARFNSKWLNEDNIDAAVANLVPHIVARRIGAVCGKDVATTADQLGATHPDPLAGLKTPTSCVRKPKTRKWLYQDTSGKTRAVTTRIHNRMQREYVVYTYKDNGARIDRTRFCGEA